MNAQEVRHNNDTITQWMYHVNTLLAYKRPKTHRPTTIRHTWPFFGADVVLPEKGRVSRPEEPSKSGGWVLGKAAAARGLYLSRKIWYLAIRNDTGLLID